MIIRKPDYVEVEAAEKSGYATYNGGPHLLVAVPNGYSTITCQLSNGEQVTFSFMPYKTGDVPPDCVDIYHATGERMPSQDSVDRRETKAIVFENPYRPDGKMNKSRGYHWHDKGNAPCTVCVVFEKRAVYEERSK